MKKILILGGYGGFGARLSLELAARRHQILVAGRSLRKAKRFCDTVENAKPVQADRDGDIREITEQHQPDLLIDAAGSFQGSSYKLVQQCIALKIPYLDLADGRNFVCGIGTLDGAATAAGISVISGASSVPAQSGAVIRHLATGFRRASIFTSNDIDVNPRPALR